MKTLQVPQTTYVTYDLTDAEEYALNIFLDLDVSYAVVSRQAVRNQARTEPQLVLAIKWWRTRFACGLKEAKDAVEAYVNQTDIDARRTEIGTKEVPAAKPESFKLIGFISCDNETDFCRYHDGTEENYGGRQVYVQA